MAKIGLKYPVYAPYTATGSTVTYTTGGVIAKAIESKINIETNEVTLYADDAIAESDKSFKSGTISLGVDDLSDTVYKTLLGHSEATPSATLTDTTAKEIIAKGIDNPIFCGVGFYGRKVVSGVTKYRAVWLKKVQFKEVADENKTKGESTEFSGATLEGTIYEAADGEWKKEITVSNEADAIAWLKDLAEITA